MSPYPLCRITHNQAIRRVTIIKSPIWTLHFSVNVNLIRPCNFAFIRIVIRSSYVIVNVSRLSTGLTSSSISSGLIIIIRCVLRWRGHCTATELCSRERDSASHFASSLSLNQSFTCQHYLALQHNTHVLQGQTWQFSNSDRSANPGSLSFVSLTISSVALSFAQATLK